MAGELPLAVDDKAARRVVRRHCHGHAIAEHDADTVAPNLASELRENLVAVVQLDAKVAAFRDQDDFAVEMYELFLGHWTSWRPLG